MSNTLNRGNLRAVHHIAFNVSDMNTSRFFYGQILGLHELTGEEVPSTLKNLVAQGKVANFQTPDGTIIDLFYTPDLLPPDPDPEKSFTRTHHLAFDIEPKLFDYAVAVLKEHQIRIDGEIVTRPTGRGIYFYDPDGFMIEIRCNPS